VYLGQIELLVQQGFYSHRADFIRLAIGDQLAKHADTVRKLHSPGQLAPPHRIPIPSELAHLQRSPSPHLRNPEP
jgi:Arc/MetJ-type ribon-helix-helix transcriptional regulator